MEAPAPLPVCVAHAPSPTRRHNRAPARVPVEAVGDDHLLQRPSTDLHQQALLNADRGQDGDRTDQLALRLCAENARRTMTDTSANASGDKVSDSSQSTMGLGSMSATSSSGSRSTKCPS